MNVEDLHIDVDIRNIISREIAWHYNVVPKHKENGSLVLYSKEGCDEAIIKDDLQVVLGMRILLEKIDSQRLEKALLVNYRKSNANTDILNNSDFLENLIGNSIELGSSDIHFEIFKNEARVRIRIDGVLIERNKIEPNDYKEIVNRIKIQSNLDITEKRLPQDGRTNISGHDIRVSILPTLYGEKVVLRILGHDASNINIEDLGFEEFDKKNYLEATKKSNGIILISGPTGSGKTTTLYATLKILNEIKRNVVTVEDPIEYTLDGINQVQLKEDIGLTFASALRSFLRQDPDVIMLGEIRDKETAEMAIRAALTGHLVLSTIHTNSAFGTISRLVDMGVPSFLLAETINVSVAQRLVRKLCAKCKKQVSIDFDKLPDNLNKEIKFDSYYISVGCDSCFYTGYTGRRAIYEVLPMNKDLANIVRSNSKNNSKQFLNKNKSSLSEKALQLVKSGDTSLEEVYAILINKS